MNISFVFDTEGCIDPLRLYESCMVEGLDPSSFLNKANSFRTSVGRFPGVGYILLSRASLTKIQRREHPIHTLTISDGTTNVIIRRLRITYFEAVHPTFSSGETGRTSPESIYLCRIEDIRSLASQLPINNSWNRVDLSYPYGTQGREKPMPYPDLLREVWNCKTDRIETKLDGTTSLQSLQQSLGTLNIQGITTKRDPRDNRFDGISAWSALHSVIDECRAVYVQDYASFSQSVIGPGAFETKAFDDLLPLNLLAQRLLNFKSNEDPSPLPEKVVVHFHNLDFQHQLDPLTDTALDSYYNKPTGSLAYLTTSLLNIKESDQIVPGLIHHVWCNWPKLRVLSQGSTPGETVASTYLETRWADYMKACAVDHIADLQALNTWSEYTFSGAVSLGFKPPVITGYAWFDFGQGLQSTLFKIPREFNPDITLNLDSIQSSFQQTFTTPPTETISQAPDLARQHVPYNRFLIGKTAATIKQDYQGDVKILYGLSDLTSVELSPGKIIKAYNFLGELKKDRRVFLWFNHQLENGGAWQIVATTDTNDNTPTESDKYALYGIAYAKEPFCGGRSVEFEDIYYFSQPPFTKPWPLAGPEEEAARELDPTKPYPKEGTASNGELDLSGAEGAALFLVYNHNDPAKPVIVQTTHICKTVVTDLVYDSYNCRMYQEVWQVALPFVEQLMVPLIPTTKITYTESYYFDPNACTIMARRQSACILGQILPTPLPIEVYNVRSTPENCCPCPPCTCQDLPSSFSGRLKTCNSTSDCDVNIPLMFHESSNYDDNPCGIIESDLNSRMWVATFSHTYPYPIGTDNNVLDPEEDNCELPGKTVTYEVWFCCIDDEFIARICPLDDNGERVFDCKTFSKTSQVCDPLSYLGKLSNPHPVSSLPWDWWIQSPSSSVWGVMEEFCDATPFGFGECREFSDADDVFCLIIGDSEEAPAVQALPAVPHYQDQLFSGYHSQDGFSYGP